MSKGIDIPIKRAGFPVKIGEVEIWFDDRIEAISDFWDRDEKAREQLEELDEKIEKSQLKDIDETNVDREAYNSTFDFKKEELKIRYDSLLGEGTFEQIYSRYPDIRELMSIYEPLEEAIVEIVVDRMQTYEKERKKEFESKKKEYLKKKAKKK
ncbi:hypothetical protein D5F11_021720 [Siminovitchia terrae]|uniref:Uncharacterized protein n=1 Tax=Siminovitchia terrae TaxID=1914933 RepID=A0A429X2U2_SIMTE|nr:hypothetical protein [Siminovitchia terrae]RST57681.1 hypothetical protein D5F11_021720 [Siminovitchia terrae]